MYWRGLSLLTKLFVINSEIIDKNANKSLSPGGFFNDRSIPGRKRMDCRLLM